MRDPARIDVILEAIRNVWVEYPDLRLAQLIYNATGSSQPCPELFYCEDNDLLRSLRESLKKRGRKKRPAIDAGSTILTTEELGDVANPSPGDIEKILGEDSFGKFAILSRSETTFVQAASMWEPGKEVRKFIKDHGSDPFCLQYRDSDQVIVYQAVGHVTLDQVKNAFLAFLKGDEAWRTSYEWKRVDL